MAGSSPRKLNIAVVGKTGVGKSSLCNALVKAENYKDPCAVSPGHFVAQTKDCQRVQRVSRGRNLTIVDSPGTIDTERKNDLSFDPLKEIDKVMTFCPEGFHAFLLVLRLDSKITDEEKEAIKQLKKYLGDTFLTFTIVVFSHGDHVGNDESEFKQVVNESKSQDSFLKLLLRQCSNRIVMVDAGRQRDERVLDEQLEQLLKMVEEDLKGDLYTQENVEENRDKSIPTFKRESLNILIFGESGTGKSSVANSLLGTDEFKVTGPDGNASDKVTKATIGVRGKTLTVVEAPGFDSEDELQMKIDKTKAACKEGFDVCLLVMRADSDLSIGNLKPAIDLMREYSSTFKNLESKLIFVFTHIESFYSKRDFEKKFKEAKAKSNDHLAQLLKSCDARKVCLGSFSGHWTKDMQEEELEELHELMDKVKREAEARRQAEDESRRRQAEDESRRRQAEDESRRRQAEKWRPAVTSSPVKKSSECSLL